MARQTTLKYTPATHETKVLNHSSAKKSDVVAEINRQLREQVKEGWYSEGEVHVDDHKDQTSFFHAHVTVKRAIIIQAKKQTQRKTSGK